MTQHACVPAIPFISSARDKGITVHCYSPRAGVAALDQRSTPNYGGAAANVYVYVKSSSTMSEGKRVSDDVGQVPQDANSSSSAVVQQLSNASIPTAVADYVPQEKASCKQQLADGLPAKQQALNGVELKQCNGQLEAKVASLQQQLCQAAEQREQHLQIITAAEMAVQKLQQEKADLQRYVQQLQSKTVIDCTAAELHRLQDENLELQEDKAFLEFQLAAACKASVGYVQQLEQCRAQLDELLHRDVQKDAKVAYALPAAAESLELSISLQEAQEQQHNLQHSWQQPDADQASRTDTYVLLEDHFLAATEAASHQDTEAGDIEGSSCKISERNAGCNECSTLGQLDGKDACMMAGCTPASLLAAAECSSGYRSELDAYRPSVPGIRALECLLLGGWDQQWTGACAEGL